MVFLHGLLLLEVVEAKDLPNLDDTFFSRMSKNISDPYVTVDIYFEGRKTSRIAKTRVIEDNVNPKWDENFQFNICNSVDSLMFTVKDMDLVKIEHMGILHISAEDLAAGTPRKGWYPLEMKGRKAGSLHISVQYLSMKSRSGTNEVPECVFPMRTGCGVRLYQDADTPPLPPVTDVVGRDGEPYKPHQCWVEIANAMENAQRLIYVLGWSVNPEISLQRGPGENETLGEVLKRRARDGVRVLVMVWDEALSTDVYPPGMMGTHDEETKAYFQGSEVEVALASRRKLKSKLRDKIFTTTTYTHHQKCVITDAEIEGDHSRRRLVGFAGGIDLTDGRYDTPEHPLYKTLTTSVNKDDFYNGICQSSVNVGPREPWHDIHMYLEGPAVNDLMTNFVERWRCQAAHKESRLLPLSEDEFDLEWSTPPETPSWNMQFFRSINSDSAQFDLKMLELLPSRKGRTYDNSIHKAYIHHIRRAKRFIYIENQYFLGSSHSWNVPQTKAPNLIPVELAVRIVDAINAGNDFRVYITIPMHPEGDPQSAAVQEILHWQHATMNMMYGKIARALSDKGIEANPTDYLSFFCLGKRESPADVPRTLEQPPVDSVAEKARQSLRFMIYVHSKFAVFDDEYVIIGSANINERSMNGNRDSELAFGAYQPDFTKEVCGDAEIGGDVSTFRRAVWAEHCGSPLKEHMQPSSKHCMVTMRDLGEENLKKYLHPKPEHNASHLMNYPLKVYWNGRVESREDCKFFPDTGGLIVGKPSNMLPNSLTT